jgi:hypothetical protein
VFEAYKAFYGTDELEPIGPARLARIDPNRRLFALHLRPLAATLGAFSPPAPFSVVRAIESGDSEIAVTFEATDPLVVAIRAPGAGIAGFERMSLHVVARPKDLASAANAVRALVAHFTELGERPTHPIGDDPFAPVTRSIAVRLARLRRCAPFGYLAWDTLVVKEEGRRAELGLRAPSGERATVWLAERGGRPTGGYDVGPAPGAAIVEGLRAVIGALRGEAVEIGASAGG